MKLRSIPRLTLPTITAFGLIIAGASLLLFKLGSLTNGFANNEIQLPGTRAALEQIWQQPFFIPYSLAELATATVLPGNGYTASRIPAVLLGAGTAIMLYCVLKQWYGQRLAIFGTALLLTAPWFLHVSRLATPAVTFPFAMAVVLVLAVWWHRKERSRWTLYATAVLAALILSVPGAIWLLLIVFVIERTHIIASVKAMKLHAGLASVVFLILITPLLHILYKTKTLEWPALLAGAEHRPEVMTYLTDFVRVWQNLFIGGYQNPVFNLASLPVVNLLMSLAFLIGIYLYAQHPKASRTRLLAILWVAGTAIIALPNTINLTYILPILTVLATGGLGYLLHLWLKVFPRNPLARAFGIGLIALLVFFGIAYNIRSYYVAWPNNDATRAAFSRQL
jgi:4-amino-4-deoxy-L-arabinose transferase-like glycosyltransferase